jgi:hypothetical protein
VEPATVRLSGGIKDNWTDSGVVEVGTTDSERIKDDGEENADEEKEGSAWITKPNQPVQRWKALTILFTRNSGAIPHHLRKPMPRGSSICICICICDSSYRLYSALDILSRQVITSLMAFILPRKRA